MSAEAVTRSVVGDLADRRLERAAQDAEAHCLVAHQLDYTGVQEASYPDGSEWFVVVIGEIRDGHLWRVQTFFAPTFEPPA
jgi:hypothetical protein